MRATESTEPAQMSGSDVASETRAHERRHVAVVAVGEQVDAVDARGLGPPGVVAMRVDGAAQQARVPTISPTYGKKRMPLPAR